MPYITFVSFGNTKGEYVGASRLPQTDEYRIFTALKSEKSEYKKVTISMGGTIFDSSIEQYNADEFTNRADKALYMAKDKGRNTTVVI